MTKCFDFLNRYSGVIQAISAMAIVILTIIIASSNKKYVKLTNSMLEISENNYKQLVQTRRPLLSIKEINPIVNSLSDPYIQGYKIMLTNNTLYPARITSYRFEIGVSTPNIFRTSSVDKYSFLKNSAIDKALDFTFGPGPLPIAISCDLSSNKSKEVTKYLREGQSIQVNLEIKYSDIGTKLPQQRMFCLKFISYLKGNSIIKTPIFCGDCFPS